MVKIGFISLFLGVFLSVNVSANAALSQEKNEPGITVRSCVGLQCSVERFDAPLKEEVVNSFIKQITEKKIQTCEFSPSLRKCIAPFITFESKGWGIFAGTAGFMGFSLKARPGLDKYALTIQMHDYPHQMGTDKLTEEKLKSARWVVCKESAVEVVAGFGRLDLLVPSYKCSGSVLSFTNGARLSLREIDLSTQSLIFEYQITISGGGTGSGRGFTAINLSEILGRNEANVLLSDLKRSSTSNVSTEKVVESPSVSPSRRQDVSSVAGIDRNEVGLERPTKIINGGTQTVASGEGGESVNTTKKVAAERREVDQSALNRPTSREVAYSKPAENSERQSKSMPDKTRKALVIGNNAYTSVTRLQNARGDAIAMAEGLSGVGYSVTLITDATRSSMNAAIRRFKSQLAGGDEVVIFYAGHAVQIQNVNYLLPIDIAAKSEDGIRDDAVELQRILDDVSSQKAKFTVAVVDACRDNPFQLINGRSIGGTRGLSPTTAATGQMIVFSAGTGQQALDNLGAADKDTNGVFTRVFLKHLKRPGVSIDQMVRDVREEVYTLAKSIGHDQVPAVYDQVLGRFYFVK